MNTQEMQNKSTGDRASTGRCEVVLQWKELIKGTLVPASTSDQNTREVAPAYKPHRLIVSNFHF